MSALEDAALMLSDECDMCGRMFLDCRCCEQCGGTGVIGDTPGGRGCGYCDGTGDITKGAIRARDIYRKQRA